MATRGLQFSPGRRRRWCRVSAARIKDPRIHPHQTREAATAVPPAPRRPAAPRERLPGYLGAPGRRRPLGSAALGLQARWRRLGLGRPRRHNAAPEPRRRRRLCSRPAADTKPAAAHRPWAPAPGSRSVLVTAFQTLQPSRQSRSAADLLISAPQGSGRRGLADHRLGAARQGQPAAAPPSISPGSARAGPAARLAAPPPGAAPGPAAHGRSRLRAPRWVSPKEPPPRLRRLLNPFAPRPRRRPGPGPWCHLAAARPRAPPARAAAPSGPPSAPPGLPGAVNATLASRPPCHPPTSPLGKDGSCLSGRNPRTRLADGPLGLRRSAASCSSSCPDPPRNPRGDLTPNAEGRREQNPPARVHRTLAALSACVLTGEHLQAVLGLDVSRRLRWGGNLHLLRP